MCLENRTVKYLVIKGENELTLIVYDMTSLLEIDWIDNFIITVIFITIKILGLSAVTLIR